MSAAPHVLHVAESFGGGTQSAITSYCSATPEYRHSAVVRVRSDSETGDCPSSLGTVRAIEGSLVRFALDARKVILAARPDIVHLHSSKAGLVRAVAPFRTAVIYTPHCYAFERTDLNSGTRAAIRLTERLLARRRQLVVAVGPREAALSRAIQTGPVVIVPNAVPSVAAERRQFPANRPIRVITCGRVSVQKDPAFFARVVEAVRADVQFTWVGGGDTDLARVLRKSGVEVTGWVPRERAVELMASADAYLHTAAWESNPFTLLEAASARLPIVTRSIPSLTAMGFFAAGQTPSEVAAGLERAISDPQTWESVCRVSDQILRANCPPAQARALRSAYEMAIEFG